MNSIWYAGPVQPVRQREYQPLRNVGCGSRTASIAIPSRSNCSSHLGDLGFETNRLPIAMRRQ